ncbi:LOW QUALITY PROTEIN: hypothetical protein TorRG33x02_039660 [Trema orientale]|uniref:Uncharacterized protein n=1 Tax=Trema orientale TaxID=63057 RepID=A0A2P5FQW2_TREOI|nr:LOW QUALITY PROTEIN: hypothetical protein TorRG33x02_039660 [Trema orientale]
MFWPKKSTLMAYYVPCVRPRGGHIYWQLESHVGGLNDHTFGHLAINRWKVLPSKNTPTLSNTRNSSSNVSLISLVTIVREMVYCERKVIRL